MGFAGGVKEIKNSAKLSKGAIRKSCSGNLLRYGWVDRCSFATGTGPVLGHPLSLRTLFSVMPSELLWQLFSVESQAVAP